jgi:rhodanese-related sulfurtransferase
VESIVDKIIVEDVSLEELKAGLADGSIALVDVREPVEWDAGHIPGATLNALSVFDPDSLPEQKPGQRIVLHCRSGRRSITALGMAQASGRMDIRAHFTGGMLEWQGAGEDVITD